MLLAFLLSATTALSVCPVTPGASALFDEASAKIVWVGEVHGTAEQPALFGDLVCAASETRRPVVVALERSALEQDAWDAFLSSDGGAAAEAALLKGVGWVSALQDGRSSRAMLALAHRLRRFKAEGRIAAVHLILSDGTKDLSREDYEAYMAAEVAESRKLAPDALVLAYSGNVHARKSTMTGLGDPYRLAAEHLPPTDVMSVIIESGAGTAWNCQVDTCGPHPFKRRDETAAHPRGVVMGATQEGVDAVAYTGTGTTASPPAVGPATPVAIPKALLAPITKPAPGDGKHG